MPVVPTSDPNDPRLEDYRAVPDPELVRVRGLFVAEGRSVVERLIRGGRWPIRSLLLSDAALNALAPAIAVLPSETPIYVAPLDVFRATTGFNIHRGCLALAERRADPDPDALLEHAQIGRAHV